MDAALSYSLFSPSTAPLPLPLPLPLKRQLSSKPKLSGNLPTPPSHSFKLQMQRQQCNNRCVALGSGSAAELEADRIINAEEEEWLKRGECKDKESKGIVELLECLEREAIMGDDEGKEPTDYNRRAQIFDKSSRVFQALKLKDPTPLP